MKIGQVLKNRYNGKSVVLKEIKIIAGIKTYIFTKPYDNNEEVHLYEDEIK